MSRSLTERWNRLRTELTLKDLSLDLIGKIVAALGIGALWHQYLHEAAWAMIGIGISLSLAVKRKYWNRFWEG